MARPYIIPFFITHQGCPHRCVFCNQIKIAGAVQGTVTAADVVAGITERLQKPRHKSRGVTIVAFYGGSFTGLPLPRQIELLDAVQPFIEKGAVAGIRLSTRPDCIDPDIVSFLKKKGVMTVELGVQSMDDQVLARSNRGHSAADSEKAIKCIRNGGLEIGIQLMAGLPEQSTTSCLLSAKKIADLAPDLVRIYPAVVLKESDLAERYESGCYRPLSLERAIVLCGMLKNIFDRAQIKVVRIGLQATETLADSILAGPYHPAFGEMVRSRNLHMKIGKLLSAPFRVPRAKLVISEADQSVFRGPGNAYLKRLESKGLLQGIEPVFEHDVERGSAQIVA